MFTQAALVGDFFRILCAVAVVVFIYMEMWRAHTLLLTDWLLYTGKGVRKKDIGQWTARWCKKHSHSHTIISYDSITQEHKKHFGGKQTSKSAPHRLTTPQLTSPHLVDKGRLPMKRSQLQLWQSFDAAVLTRIYTFHNVSRIRLKLSCLMDFRLFPLDKQMCPMKMRPCE